MEEPVSTRILSFSKTSDSWTLTMRIHKETQKRLKKNGIGIGIYSLTPEWKTIQPPKSILWCQGHEGEGCWPRNCLKSCHSNERKNWLFSLCLRHVLPHCCPTTWAALNLLYMILLILTLESENKRERRKKTNKHLGILFLQMFIRDCLCTGIHNVSKPCPLYCKRNKRQPYLAIAGQPYC